jgi:hypothetical protein
LYVAPTCYRCECTITHNYMTKSPTLGAKNSRRGLTSSVFFR